MTGVQTCLFRSPKKRRRKKITLINDHWHKLKRTHDSVFCEKHTKAITLQELKEIRQTFRIEGQNPDEVRKDETENMGFFMGWICFYGIGRGTG